MRNDVTWLRIAGGEEMKEMGRFRSALAVEPTRVLVLMDWAWGPGRGRDLGWLLSVCFADLGDGGVRH